MDGSPDSSYLCDVFFKKHQTRLQVLPSANPVSFPWLLAGLLPWAVALVVVPPLVALSGVIALLPCMVRY